MKYIAIAFAGILLSACTETETISSSVETVPNWTVADVSVSVPETLTVSEDPDVRIPQTDIVWWEDPAGDRRAQVAGLVEAAASGVVKGTGETPVVLQIQVSRFHAVTPVTRASGLFSRHDLILNVTPLDPSNGTAVGETERLGVTIDALAGSRAEAAVARGETQRVRISRAIVSALNSYIAAQGS